MQNQGVWADQIRPILLLEMAAELVWDRSWPATQTRVLMRKRGSNNPWRYNLFASDAPSSFDEVVRNEVQLAMVNPAAPLGMAVRGTGPYKEPLPLRVITTLPSADQFGMAVAESTGITSLAEIGAKRYPLRISMREQTDHADYIAANEVFKALGFSLDELVAWGGKIVPRPRLGIDLGELERGEIDAFFEEGVHIWVGQALDAGMRLLPVDPPLAKKLEAIGWPCSLITKAQFPQLAEDVLSPDFSGWPIFTHAEAPDDLVRSFCQALEARKDRIPWEGGPTRDGPPLPLEWMCKDTPDTPLCAPLHPAAEAFWHEQGYI